MSKHTPGPWEHDQPENMIVKLNADGTQSLIAQARSTHFPIEVRDSNARLIASAPDLLMALRDLEIAANSLQYCFDRRPENFGVALTQLTTDAKRARAIFLKATGELA